MIERYEIELRAEVAGDLLRGHAAVFGQVARVPGGWEAMGRAAFDAVLSDPSTDAVSLVNHDPGKLLGRQSAGTLQVGTDSSGLEFEVQLPATTYANDLRISVERGDLNGGSLGFVPGADKFSRAQDGRALRTHTSIKGLRDVSPVTFPAYDTATVRLRSLDDWTDDDDDDADGNIAVDRRRRRLIEVRARARRHRVNRSKPA